MQRTAVVLAKATTVVEQHLLGTGAVLKWFQRTGWTTGRQLALASAEAAKIWKEEDLLKKGTRFREVVANELEKVKAADEAARLLLKERKPAACRCRPTKSSSAL